MHNWAQKPGTRDLPSGPFLPKAFEQKTGGLQNSPSSKLGVDRGLRGSAVEIPPGCYPVRK